MADQHHDEPDVPGLPTIQDEAADTPPWVPATGLALLVLMVLMLVYRVSQPPETEGAAEGDVAAEVAEGEAAGGEPAEGEAAPAEGEAPAPAPAGEDVHAGHGH